MEFLKKLDCWLRNVPYPEPEFYEVSDIDDLFRPQPWQTYIYYKIYRLGNKIIEFPGDIYNKIKWFIQRGKRGYADCDIWSLDWYLDSWMPDALRKLKEDKHGIPCCMFEEGDHDLEGEAYDAATLKAQTKWEEILDKMISGFEASKRMKDGTYEEELGSYPYPRPDNVTKEEWKKIKDKHFEDCQILKKRDEKIFEEGMQLFVRFYGNLWN